MQLGEDLEIGAVGRQVERGCADRLNGLVYAGDLPDDELVVVVQGLLDPGKEAAPLIGPSKTQGAVIRS